MDAACVGALPSRKFLFPYKMALEPKAKGETSRRGRTLKRPRQVYEPPSDFESEEESAGETIDGTEDDEEEEDEDTDLSGFIVADDDEDGSYVPSEDGEDEEEEDTEDEAESDPLVVTRENLIDKLMEFSEKSGLSDEETEEAVLSQMIVAGYKFPFLKETDQLKLFPFYKNKRAPPVDLVRSVFRL